MADKNSRTKNNVDGKYYVDKNCIGCGVCANEAPENFTLSDDNSYAFVKKQPDSEKETEVSENALESCPVNAIGNDG